MIVGTYKCLSPSFRVYNTCLSLAVWTQPMGAPLLWGHQILLQALGPVPQTPIHTGLELAHPLDPHGSDCVKCRLASLAENTTEDEEHLYPVAGLACQRLWGRDAVW